jgi:hypothetical protein
MLSSLVSGCISDIDDANAREAAYPADVPV